MRHITWDLDNNIFVGYHKVQKNEIWLLGFVITLNNRAYQRIYFGYI